MPNRDTGSAEKAAVTDRGTVHTNLATEEGDDQGGGGKVNTEPEGTII